MISKENIKVINSKNIKENKKFPYLVLSIKNNIAKPLTAGFRVYHWHQDLQFVYVLSGNIHIKTFEENIALNAGEGLFINKNVIHMIDNIENAEYRCFIFPEYVATFYVGGPAEKIVKSITENNGLPIVKFTKEENWNIEVLNILEQLAVLEENKTDYYFYEVLTHISVLWLNMIKNIEVPISIVETPVSIRVRKMLYFIEQNYEKEISLEMLAESANVSKSEALRCFKMVLHTTPYRYLMDYRIAKAITFIEETNLPIYQIAMKTGFNQQSYFGKCFREKMKCSPKQYRKQYFQNKK